MNLMTSWAFGPNEIRGICLSTLGVCGGCGKRPPSPGGVAQPSPRCSRCKAESYCNADCQRLAWRNGHKKACKVLSNTFALAYPLPEVLESRRVSKATREAIVSVTGAPSTKDKDDAEAKSEKLFAKALDLLSGKIGLLDGPDELERIKNLPEGLTDAGEAHSLLRQAADLGHKAAQYTMALAYLDGEYLAKKENGVKADEAKLLEWTKMAAENGHAEAQLTYGCKFWYEGRNGHTVDMRQAVTWVRRALAHGVSVTEGRS